MINMEKVPLVSFFRYLESGNEFGPVIIALYRIHEQEPSNFTLEY